MRSTAETLALDASLRQSRTIYVTLAIIFLPLAVGGLIGVFSAVRSIVEFLSSGYFATSSILVLLFGVICIGAEYVTVRQCVEANRRLRMLRDHPECKVRRMAAPFQSSLFGPYH